MSLHFTDSSRFILFIRYAKSVIDTKLARKNALDWNHQMFSMVKMRENIHAADILNTMERMICVAVPKIENPVPTKNPPVIVNIILNG